MTEWGNWIETGSVGYPVKGERPVWLIEPGSNVSARLDDGRVQVPNEATIEDVRDWQWFVISAFRLPADHWAYAPIAAGYTPWAGGEAAPYDDIFGVMLRSGSMYPMYANYYWSASGSAGDIIGYKRNGMTKPENFEPPAKHVPAQEPLYKQAARLLHTVSEQFGTPVKPGMDVAEILTQIDNVTTGVHVPTLDKCIGKAAMMPAPWAGGKDAVKHDERKSVVRQLEALRPTDPTETLARELAEVVNAHDGPRVEWDAMPSALQDIYRALANHTLTRVK